MTRLTADLFPRRGRHPNRKTSEYSAIRSTSRMACHARDARALVASRNWAGRLTVGFRLTAGAGTGPASRSQPGREVPDDHCHPIHRARHDPARLHRCRAVRPRRVPGRVPRPDPRGLRPGPAPVRQLVPQPARWPCSPSAAPTSRASPATWKPGAGPGPPSPGGCAPSPGSTSTPSKKSSWTAPRPRTSAGRGSTTSPMPSPWTATSSARCWSPPGSARRPSTR